MISSSLVHVNKARAFLFVKLHFTFRNFKVWRLKKKIKIKTEFEPKTYNISGTLDMIYTGDIYKKKEVNFKQKIHLMGKYFNLNDLKGWQGFVENTWNN